MDYKVKRLWIFQSIPEKKRWSEFLLKNGIRPENSVDYTVGIFDGDTLAATGSLFQNIIKCVAVSPIYQGGTVFNLLLSHLTNEIYDSGKYSVYVYTKPESVEAFTRLGFKIIASVNDRLVFLEKATQGFSDYLSKLSQCKTTLGRVSAIVMNANPFTLGHQYLVEYASQRSDALHVFVLSEDLSDFPCDVRYRLVQAGTQHLPNVQVHTTGDYMVSAKTFPAYFLPDDADVTKTQAALDATVFLKVAQTLNINHRFVGEEPSSVATNIYNSAMTQVFKGHICLTIIPRKTNNSEVISASRVRMLLEKGKTEQTRQLLPPTTYDFLLTEEGKRIIDKLKNK